MVFRLKRCEPLVHVQKDFMCESARDVPVTELPLSINVTIEFVRVAGKRRIISEKNGAIPHTSRTGAGNDRLALANLPIPRSFRRSAEIIRESSRKRQFVERMNPVGSQIIELPIRVGIRFL